MDIVNLFVDPILHVLPKLPAVIIDLVIGYITIKILLWILNNALKITKIPKLRSIIVSLSRLALWVILIIFIANSLGFDKLAVAMTGSVLVIAFVLNTGLAPLITDVISGIFLCTDPDFKVGSKVRIGHGDATIEGILKEVDMRKVRIIDTENNIVVVPNSIMDKDKWVVVEKKESVMRSKAQEKAVQVREKAKRVIKNKLKK